MIENRTVRNLSPASQNCGLGFFLWRYRLTSNQGPRILPKYSLNIATVYPWAPEIRHRLPMRAWAPKKLPVALSLDEVVRFLEAVPGLESRAALTGPTFRAFLLALMKT
jgi:integrase